LQALFRDNEGLANNAFRLTCDKGESGKA